MPSALHSVLVLLHLLAAIVWVGGMFFAHFCLRPAAVATLEPPQRLPLMAAALGRFFGFVAVASTVLLVTGFVMLVQVGSRAAPIGWLVMLGLGLVMTALFLYVWRVPYPKLRAHCAAAAWPAGAQALNDIRRLVTVNLVLGVAAVVSALWAR